MTRPAEDEYAPFYRGYVTLVPESNVIDVLREQTSVVRNVGVSVPRETERFAYAPGKWTIRQVLGHVGDAERVFGFRAFCFSRGEPSALPGFDENSYVDRSRFDEVPCADLVEEFVALRTANLRMLGALHADQWTLHGVANGARVSVRALAYVMAGHVRHHLRVLEDRYAVPIPS